MEILNREALFAFAKKHPLSRKPLSRWAEIAAAAFWANIIDVQRDFKTAEDVRGYAVFNIHGNAYRLISVIRYQRNQLIVHEILTHSEYDRWNP